MITFLTSPKAFAGIAKVHQARAIRSWQAVGDDVEVILYGDAAGIDEAGGDLRVKVVKEIECAPSGVPYFGAIAAHAVEHAKHDLQVYLNCDILLFGILPALKRIWFPQFLLVGQRIDLGEGLHIDVADGGWLQQLVPLVAEGRARLHSPTGKDYFGFRRGMWQGLPPVVIGRGGYDNALLAYCMRNGIPIVDGTFAVMALHQFHGYEHVQGGVEAVMRGPDALRNVSHAGGARGSTLVTDADYRLVGTLVEPRPWRSDPLRRLELRLRHKAGWHKAALALRLVWRGLQTVGIVHVPQPTLDEVIACHRRSNGLGQL